MDSSSSSSSSSSSERVHAIVMIQIEHVVRHSRVFPRDEVCFLCASFVGLLFVRVRFRASLSHRVCAFGCDSSFPCFPLSFLLFLFPLFLLNHNDLVETTMKRRIARFASRWSAFERRKKTSLASLARTNEDVRARGGKRSIKMSSQPRRAARNTFVATTKSIRYASSRLEARVYPFLLPFLLLPFLHEDVDAFVVVIVERRAKRKDAQRRRRRSDFNPMPRTKRTVQNVRSCSQRRERSREKTWSNLQR